MLLSFCTFESTKPGNKSTLYPGLNSGFCTFESTKVQWSANSIRMICTLRVYIVLFVLSTFKVQCVSPLYTKMKFWVLIDVLGFIQKCVFTSMTRLTNIVYSYMEGGHNNFFIVINLNKGYFTSSQNLAAAQSTRYIEKTRFPYTSKSLHGSWYTITIESLESK